MIALISALVSVAENKPKIKTRFIKKRPDGITGALFFVLPIMAFATAEAACPIPEGQYFEVKSAYAIDGDTIALADGRHLRLIGVNTPEIGRQGKVNQPLAAEAREQTKTFLAAAISLQISVGSESHDRYGRLLAHVSNHRGESLEELLVSQGLAYYIAVPPNLDFVGCLSAAEQAARAKQRGLWGKANFAKLANVPQRQIKYSAGFQLLRGKVLELNRGKASHWLNLDSGVGLRVSDTDLLYFQQLQLDSLLGETVEVRGWLIPVNRQLENSDYPKWLMHLRHPSMLDVL